MHNYKVQFIFNANKKDQHQRTVLVKQVANDENALVIAKVYIDRSDYSTVSITRSNAAIEKRISEIIHE